jgi:hypothetical protein
LHDEREKERYFPFKNDLKGKKIIYRGGSIIVFLVFVKNGLTLENIFK